MGQRQACRAPASVVPANCCRNCCAAEAFRPVPKGDMCTQYSRGFPSFGMVANIE